MNSVLYCYYSLRKRPKVFNSKKPRELAKVTGLFPFLRKKAAALCRLLQPLQPYREYPLLRSWCQFQCQFQQADADSVILPRRAKERFSRARSEPRVYPLTPHAKRNQTQVKPVPFGYRSLSLTAYQQGPPLPSGGPSPAGIRSEQ